MSFDLQLKLLLIGDSGVGKSSMLKRYANNDFTTAFVTTIGIDFKTKTIPVDNHIVKLQIWDTAGQERFRGITASYFRGAHGVLVIYDITDRSSFENVSNWIGQIEQHADECVSRVLVGNKCDAAHNRVQVTEAEGKELADAYGIPFFLISSKENIRVSDAFDKLAIMAKRQVLGKVTEHVARVEMKEAKTMVAFEGIKGGCCDVM